MTDRKAAAAGDTPQQTETKPVATTTPAKPTEAEIRTWLDDLLVHISEQEDGRALSKLELEKFGKSRGNKHPELIQALLGVRAVHVDVDGNSMLTPLGWREAMKIQAARSALALKKKDDELSAHKLYHQQEQQLLNEIKAAEATLESKKGAVQAAKADLEASHEALAAHVAGGVQTPFLDAPKKEEKPGTAPTIAPEWAKVLPAVDPKGVRVFPAAGCPQQTVVVNSLIHPQVMQQEKRKIDNPVEAFGINWIVSALWIEEKTGASRANLLPLLSKDEWQQINEANYGRAVDTFDQSDDAKHLRQKGGPWCGLVVRSGRQVFVVGPQSSAVHVVHPAPEAAPKK